METNNVYSQYWCYTEAKLWTASAHSLQLNVILFVILENNHSLKICCIHLFVGKECNVP